jgi:hypothetical protein
MKEITIITYDTRLNLEREGVSILLHNRTEIVHLITLCAHSVGRLSISRHQNESYSIVIFGLHRLEQQKHQINRTAL